MLIQTAELHMTRLPKSYINSVC